MSHQLIQTVIGFLICGVLGFFGRQVLRVLKEIRVLLSANVTVQLENHEERITVLEEAIA